MQDDFQGRDTITLQPGDTNVPYRFKFTPCTATTKADGAIPYGSTLHAVSAINVRSTDLGQSSSTGMVVSAALSSNQVVAYLTYTTALPSGQYKLTVKVQVNTGGSTAMKRQFDFRRLYLKDR